MLLSFENWKVAINVGYRQLFGMLGSLDSEGLLILGQASFQGSAGTSQGLRSLL
jgi:hypothetical protein